MQGTTIQNLDKKFPHFRESEVHYHFDKKPSQYPVLRRNESNAHISTI